MLLRRALKILRRLLFISVLSILLIGVVGGGLLYYYQDKIIASVVQELNQYILKPVEVSKINVTWWEKFPRIALVFEQVKIKESKQEGAAYLASVQKVYATFDFWKLFEGQYSISSLYVEDGFVQMKRYKDGTNNYTFIKQLDEQSSKTVTLNIEQIFLKQVNYQFINHAFDQQLSCNINQSKAQLILKDEHVLVNFDGTMLIDEYKQNNTKYIGNKQFDLLAEMDYHSGTKQLTFDVDRLNINNAQFICLGKYLFDNQFIDLSIEAKPAQFKSMLALLPNSIYQKLAPYQGNGEIQFNATINGEVSNQKRPGIQAQFSCQNATWRHPKTGKAIDNLSFNGEFTNGKFQNLQSSHLNIESFTGDFEQRPFSGKLSVHNFDDPLINTEFQGGVELATLLVFFPQKYVQKAEGLVHVNLSFDGKWSALKRKNNYQEIDASGQIQFAQVGFVLNNYKPIFKQLNGTFLFNKQDVAFNNFIGQVGESDFGFHGSIRHFFPFLLLPNQPLIVQTKVKSDFIDLDELLAGAKSEEDPTLTKSTPYTFEISPNIALDLDCQIASLQFDRFKGMNIAGDLKVKDQIASSKGIKFESGNGKQWISGSIDARLKNNVRITSQAQINGLAIDSLFYVFHNFRQDFIVERHLRGKIYADIQTQMVLDEHLVLLPHTLSADLNVKIQQGELIMFEPMQRLAGYIDADALDYLKFSDLENTIRIENQLIMLPKMEITSNVTSLIVEGTHSFGQQINYNIRVPVRDLGKKKKKKKQHFGAIQLDKTFNPYLYLIIEGTTDDYTIRIDKKSIKQKMIADIKKEGKELKEAIKTKGEKEASTAQLEEEEYFDFE